MAELNHTIVPARHARASAAFLAEILGRPQNEKPYILFSIGYPAADAEVPDLRRKSLDEVASILARGVLRLHGRIPDPSTPTGNPPESSATCLDLPEPPRPCVGAG